MKKILLIICPLLALGAILFYKFLEKDHYEARFPIDFVPFTRQPRTEVKIGDLSYQFMIDLGSSSFITMKSTLLSTLEKKPHRSIVSFDMKGNKYYSESYIIPEIKIRNITIRKIEVIEETADFLQKASVIYDSTKTTLDDDIREKPGRIGRDLFVKFHSNIFMDFGSGMMYACCHLRDRKKDGYIPSKFIRVPFELDDREGIVLTIGTDFGQRRFMLDTGATKCVVQPFVVKERECSEWRPGVLQCHSEQCVIGGKDFGGVDFLLYELAPIFERLDGVIGMDFMMKHVVYLDFGKKMAYIGKANECRKTE